MSPRKGPKKRGVEVVGGWLDEVNGSMTALNDGIDQLRVLVEDHGYDHSGIVVEDEHPPDAITISLSDTTAWTITAHKQKENDD
jgi:hypothetical protein